MLLYAQGCTVDLRSTQMGWVLNFVRCLSTWKIMKLVKICRTCEIRQQISKFEFLRIELAWCGNCSHTL